MIRAMPERKRFFFIDVFPYEDTVLRLHDVWTQPLSIEFMSTRLFVRAILRLFWEYNKGGKDCDAHLAFACLRLIQLVRQPLGQHQRGEHRGGNITLSGIGIEQLVSQ